MIGKISDLVFKPFVKNLDPKSDDSWGTHNVMKFAKTYPPYRVIDENMYKAVLLK